MNERVRYIRVLIVFVDLLKTERIFKNIDFMFIEYSSQADWIEIIWTSRWDKFLASIQNKIVG